MSVHKNRLMVMGKLDKVDTVSHVDAKDLIDSFLEYHKHNYWAAANIGLEHCACVDRLDYIIPIHLDLVDDFLVWLLKQPEFSRDNMANALKGARPAKEKYRKLGGYDWIGYIDIDLNPFADRFESER